ncbi:MAG: hypothetical protein RL220_1522 [Bacteroidota bacterium]
MDKAFSPDVDTIVHICHRKWGVGSDGLILIEPSEKADFYVNFYNPDGSVSFCGNGSRCAMHFAYSEGICGSYAVFAAVDGMHTGEINGEQISISMRDVKGIDKSQHGFVLDTGSPHLVIEHRGVEEAPLIDQARAIRYSPEYAAKGINVNLIEEVANDTLRMRTYERGVEDETLSCGTGVTAAALVFAETHPHLNMVKVITRGGELTVDLQRSDTRGFEKIKLSGPVKKVFSGEMEL